MRQSLGCLHAMSGTPTSLGMHEMDSHRITRAVLVWLTVALCSANSMAGGRGTPWPLRIIDNSSRGADGVRFADVNGDGLLDITSGWEEGGVVRVYLHPGYPGVRFPWPAVSVGAPGNLEDAVFADLDGDGMMDVISSAEGTTRGLFVHWAPHNPADYLNPDAWQTAKFPASAGRLWMYAVPVEVDGLNGIDVIAGGKDGDAKIAWFRAPPTDQRNLANWTMYVMSNVGWTMSLIPRDIDRDGDLDVVVTDRFNDAGMAGARWLENPGTGTLAQQNAWPNHFIGAQGLEPMLSDIADLDGDGLEDLLVPIFNAGVYFFRRTSATLDQWDLFPINVPANVGTAKGVGTGDIDLDGRPDLVMTFAGANPPRSGVVWMSYDNSPMDPVWVDHEISGSEGQKFDVAGLVDMDGDGDIDVVTTEEQADGVGLGVIWYENPARGILDTDADGIPDDGDGSGVSLDHPCVNGQTTACDDNCPFVPNLDQADADHDGVGTVCDACPETGFAGYVNVQGCPLKAFGDFDGDVDVDQEDFARLQLCLSGPGIPQAAPACAPALLDADQDVDANDIARFQDCMSAPATAVKSSCLY